MKKIIASFSAIAIALSGLSGCANMTDTQRGTITGAGVGAGVGGIIGATTGDGGGKRAATGAVLGGIAGGIAGNIWSKKMEFHSVFISGMEEGLCPHEQSMFEQDGLEEERRLMYVAITRARKRLYLSYAQSRMLHGQMRYGVPSRFLNEIPEKLLKPINAPMMPVEAPVAWETPRTQRVETETGQGFRIGQNVTHPKFGPGVIIQCRGRGLDAEVEVNFRQSGTKRLALQYAKLSPA